jgi:hypothetical protein
MVYKFLYGDEANVTRIMDWIQHKVDATMANRGTQGLNPREMDMRPGHFAIYSRDVEASVHFALNKTTGEITVSFMSEAYGTKGGNPWWCLAVPRAGSRTCSKITTADAPYDISILEYLQQNILVRTSPMRTTSRRKTVRSGSGSGSGSGSSRRKSRSA